MTLADRDRRALSLLGGALILGSLYYFWPSGGTLLSVASADSVATAEITLQRLRNIEASGPSKQAVRGKMVAELEVREKGLIQADSAQQAQAQTLTILRDMLSAEQIGIRATELGALQVFGEHYGLVPVTVQFECRVEQMVNVLSVVNSNPELLELLGIQVSAGDERRKTVHVRLTVAGVIPKALLPEKDQNKKDKNKKDNLKSQVKGVGI